MIRNRGTETENYTERLITRGSVWWKRLVDVQAPYRWNLRRLHPGYTLEIGCGIGRNLEHLRGDAVGIDHNATSVEVAKRRGFTALLPEEFRTSPYDRAAAFDSLLVAHVAEHMTLVEGIELIARYLPNLRPGGWLILITPQEAGFRSDTTHVEFMDFAKLRQIHERLGLEIVKQYSFPFPRIVGKVFLYNEFVAVGRRPK